MESGNGDPGRLQHIYDMLADNKPLYNSDQSYLESQLHSLIEVLQNPVDSNLLNKIKHLIPEITPPEITAESGNKIYCKGKYAKRLGCPK